MIDWMNESSTLPSRVTPLRVVGDRVNVSIGPDRCEVTVQYVGQLYSMPSFARSRLTGSLSSSSGRSSSGTDGSDMRNCARSFTSLPVWGNDTEQASAHLLNSALV